MDDVKDEVVVGKLTEEDQAIRDAVVVIGAFFKVVRRFTGDDDKSMAKLRAAIVLLDERPDKTAEFGERLIDLIWDEFFETEKS